MIKFSQQFRWRRAQGCANGSCVEVAQSGDHVWVRDSKNPQDPPMKFTRDEWDVFIAGARAGDFDFG